MEQLLRSAAGSEHASQTESSSPLPKTPRAGKANIDVMVNDFLKAWLIEGDIVAAMGYISERSFACLAQDSDDPSTFDRGLAPFQLMANLKSAYDSLGPHRSLDGLVVGTRLAKPALRVASQPHHSQFVIYAVPDDVAASFDCESELTLADPARVRRAYGNYFGATFYIVGNRDTPVALLWARDDGYWKIMSWKVGSDDATTPAPEPVAETKVARISADSTLVGRSQWLPRELAGAQRLRRGIQVSVAKELRVLQPGAKPGESGRDVVRGSWQQTSRRSGSRG